MAEEAKTFVASDLEGTLCHGIAWEGMRDYLLAHGYQWPYRRFFWQQFPRLLRYRLGLGDRRSFQETWLLQFLRLFAGFSTAEFDDMAEWVVGRLLWPTVRPEVLAELQRHGQDGRRILIVSGLFQPILDEFVGRMNTGNLQVSGLGTPLSFEDGLFSGDIEGQLNVRQHKVLRLQAVLGDGRLVAAYGDTRSDIPMLSLAAEPVAVHPDEALRQTAVDQGWRILETR